ncbi:MAG: hypothetical protein M1825_000711 [Sarcosagium campestre]|nr:MAG: hypothetical protein M1825_000711 [Sarcosagium campestre]
MVSVVRRMTKLRQLLNIRLGPGAAVLSPDVKRLHLRFAAKIYNGHAGPRKFWHECMPRLKYHNPAIPMTVEQTTDQESPALLTVTFASSSPASPASPAPTSTTADPHLSTAPTTPTTTDTAPSASRVSTIDVQHRPASEILSLLLETAGGSPVVATPADEELLQELQRKRKTAEEDSRRMAKVNADIARKEQLLRAARGDSAKAE